MQQVLVNAIDFVFASIRVFIGYLPLWTTFSTIFIGLLEGFHTFLLHLILPLPVISKKNELIQLAKEQANGKTVLITGATSGIGKEMLKIFATADWTCYFIARNSAKANNVLAEMKKLNSKNENVKALIADFADLSSVAKITQEIAKIHIDVIINNAGVYEREYKESESGHELQFTVNHLSHFLLTSRLIKQPGSIKIINISSCAHYAAKSIDFETLRLKQLFQRNGNYAISKYCNVLFTNELNKRYPTIKAYAVHPGAVRTEIYRNDPSVLFLFENFVYKFMPSVMMTPLEGSLTAVWVALSGNELPVGYYWNFKKYKMNPNVNEKQAKDLWDYSLEQISNYK